MSIINAYDESSPLIGPEAFCSSRKFKEPVSKKCIITFSAKTENYVLSHYYHKNETYTGTACGKIPVYSLLIDNEVFLFYVSPIGSAIAGACMDEVAYITGADTFIVFGSSGSLDADKTTGKVVIPTESYRDEGFSYHYMPASDYITIQNASKLASLCEKEGMPYVTGRTWTTDALYKETQNNFQKRKADGCISVEMESAGLQALCDFRGFNFYTFFFTSDVLAGTSWKNLTLGKTAEAENQINSFEVALKIAQNI